MVATNHVKEMEELNTFNSIMSKSDKIRKEIKLLKSSIIYGANASGKSNFIDALLFFKNFIINSVRNSEKINVDKFMFNESCDTDTSLFEIVFIHKDIRYRYGFEIDSSKIHNEWLFFSPLGKEAKLFIRENNKFDIGEYYKEGNGLEKRTRPDSLFLTVSAEFNVEIAKEIVKWLTKINIISGLNNSGYMGYTLSNLDNETFKNYVMNFMKIADIGIEDLSLREITNNEQIPTEVINNLKMKFDNKINVKDIKLSTRKLLSIHKKFSEDNNSFKLVPFDFDRESQGTIKLFAIAGPIIDTLNNGKILIVDELDSKLHSLLTKFIIKYFNSSENRKNSQLIFATHDLNLLDNQLFRRDQIWFTEKDRYGVSDLFSLSDYSVRANSNFNKEYLLGQYGGIPFIRDNIDLFGPSDEK